jgi:CheY-like chemotaxis protein
VTDSDSTHDLNKIATAYAKALTDDLSALVGTEITIGSPSVEVVSAGDIAADELPVGLTTCKNKEDEEDVYFNLVSRAVAVTMACLLMEQPEERVKELAEEPLDDASLDAFGEVMNVCTAVLSRVFTDEYDLPPVGVESNREAESPSIDSTWLTAPQVSVVRFQISIPNYEDGTLTMVFPPGVARKWFGIDFDEESEDEAVEPECEVSETQIEIEPTQIVFIEPSEEIRNEIEDMEEGMEHSIWTMDPEEFDPDELKEFADVGVFFIEWDLAIRTGLDLLECLRGEELTQFTPIVMMSDTPTEGKVRTAIRSGANSFMAKPVTLADLKARLDPLLLERQRAVG